MANRTGDMGVDYALSKKMAGKYDAAMEAEVINWIQQLTGDKLNSGMQGLQQSLKDGTVLIKLMTKIYEGTANLPEAAKKYKPPFKANTQNMPFKQMENIQNFLLYTEAYGVARGQIFQTVDLYESRNINQVLLCLWLLGTEAQRNKFSGPTCGMKPE